MATMITTISTKRAGKQMAPTYLADAASNVLVENDTTGNNASFKA